MTHPHSKWLVPLLGYLVAFGPLSIDTYLPSLPVIANDLHASQAMVQHSITAFLVGMAIGMLIIGPLSDQLGRKPLLLGGTLVYVATSIGCALVTSVEYLVLLRALQSVGAAAAAVLARALVRDYFDSKEAANILSTMHILSMLVMVFAPMLGAMIVSQVSWRWIFVFLASFSLVACFGVAKFIYEPERDRPSRFQLTSYFSSYWMCLKHPKVCLLILVNGLSFAGMFAYIAASAFVFIEYFNYTETTYGLLFSSNILAIIAMTFVNKALLKRASSHQALKVAVCVSISATCLMLLGGWLNTQWVVLFTLSTMAYISVTGSIGANCLAALFALVPERAGTAAGLLVSMQFALGAISTTICSLYFDGQPASLLWIMGSFGLACFVCYLTAQRLPNPNASV